MPLYDMDLQKYAKHGIEENEAKVLSGCLAGALSYVHSLLIIHHDLKPGNILIQREPMAAILGDFGAARRLLPHVSEGSNEGLSVDCCTRWYAAPEVLSSSNAHGLPVMCGHWVSQSRRWKLARHHFAMLQTLL